MDCSTASKLLEPYLDGEIDRDGTRELEAHIDACKECQAVLMNLDRIRQAIRNDAQHFVAPTHLRARISATQRVSMSPRRNTMPSWMRMAAALVLAFGAGSVSMQLWNSHASDTPQLSRDLFASHWRALAATSPIDVVSSDRHTVKPWFAGKVAQAPIVQDFADQGFPLAGGRIDYVGHERVPVLVYRHGQHLIDVFVLPSAEISLPKSHTQSQGYTLAAVRIGEQPAAIVSDMDQQEMTRFAQLLGAIK